MCSHAPCPGVLCCTSCTSKIIRGHLAKTRGPLRKTHLAETQQRESACLYLLKACQSTRYMSVYMNVISVYVCLCVCLCVCVWVCVCKREREKERERENTECVFVC